MITVQDKPDQFLQAFWDLNLKYPEYTTCVRFNHISSPFHDMDECKKVFSLKLNAAIDNEIDKLNQQIMISEEEGLDIADFLKDRRKLRNYYKIDLSKCDTIDKLIAAWPKDL